MVVLYDVVIQKSIKVFCNTLLCLCLVIIDISLFMATLNNPLFKIGLIGHLQAAVVDKVNSTKREEKNYKSKLNLKALSLSLYLIISLHLL